MSRTIEEIEAEIQQSKSDSPVLAEIDSSSRFSVWGAIVFVVATAIWVLEQLFDRHKTEIEARLAQNIFGSAEWFILKVKEFQLGDDLVRDENGALGYAQIATEKRIVTQASISTGANAVIKVAKTDAASGTPTQLSATELAALRGYVDRLQPPGAYILVNSLPADVVKLSVEVYYNPLLDVTSLSTQIEQAIKTYFFNLPFSGKILRSKVVDVIQAIEGIADVVVTQFEAKTSGGTYAPVERLYIPASGYVKIDESNAPLKDQITLKPAVI